VSAGSIRVAFQGELGAFSEEAAVILLGTGIETVPRGTFDSLFAAINDGSADEILAPVENTLAGSVHRCYDLLLESGLEISAEVIHRISHCLIGVPGARMENIRSVESHPVALAQCERFFAAHPEIKRVVAEDTAGSAKAVIAAGDPQRAAIASRRAAEVYGGQILAEHLEDDRANFTRFLLLRDPRKSTLFPAEQFGDRSKLSLVVHLAHRPGSLWQALGVFARRKIDLLKIESRPLVGQPWQYRFYLDLSTSLESDVAQEALSDLRGHVSEVHVLGCYAAAITPAA
jgi:prephenate dehydratase